MIPTPIQLNVNWIAMWGAVLRLDPWQLFRFLGESPPSFMMDRKARPIQQIGNFDPKHLSIEFLFARQIPHIREGYASGSSRFLHARPYNLREAGRFTGRIRQHCMAASALPCWTCGGIELLNEEPQKATSTRLEEFAHLDRRAEVACAEVLAVVIAAASRTCSNFPETA
ncbi:hypothetical protein [Streptomyces hydrogenans]|uniref:hypothetical protein n=1 Tax=Streptomyces hydrogenans TaxID=1873719 RepID=UPI00382017B5